MPHKRGEWVEKIKEVDREYSAVRIAVDRLLADTQSRGGTVSFRDLSRASELLEGTFIIRLFAEFETGLRSYWATVRDTHPKTEDLVNGVAARRHIPDDLIQGVHAVRIHRNSLVHERSSSGDLRDISEAKIALDRFMRRLPPEWV